MASIEEIEHEKQARRLRELFKGRFSDAEARQLLADKGGLWEAVDFVLSGDPTEVRQFINTRNRELVAQLQRDSETVKEELAHGLDTCIRQFACGSCDRYWWRKVPTRKQVSKCKRCRIRYDPVPKEHEWGLAEFKCWCGNSFWGTGWLGTQSPCYRCQNLASPVRVLPPTRPRTQKKKAPHSCTAPNCYNRTMTMGAVLSPHDGAGGDYTGGDYAGGDGYGGGGGGGGRGGRGRRGGRQRDGPDGVYLPTGDPGTHHGDVCSHTQSQRQKNVLYPSMPHRSTGSTVPTFLSQDEIMEQYDDIMSLPSIAEADEASE